MVDEVENILREIADQVRAEQALTTSSRTNGDSGADPDLQTQSSIKASLERLDSHMTTTARAWDRLPPVVSNRSGVIARVELWIKNFFKKTTNWYAWEQVNFNAAVHHSLREILSALSNLEAELQNARRQFANELASETDTLTKRTERDRKALELQIESQAKELEHEHNQQRAEQQEQQKELRAQVELQATDIAEQRVHFEELAAQLSELSTELRERSENLLQEQRVNFKQLSLEMSELATFVDRKRREIETRLSKNAKQRS